MVCFNDCPGQSRIFYTMKKDLEKLLRFIASGDQDVILEQKGMPKHLEVLVDYEMVSVKDNRLFLTKKGGIALRTGMDVFLEEFPLNKATESSSCSKMKNYLKTWDRKRKISITVWIFLLLIGILLRHSVT